jgi:lysophospholipase L1-like esterase
MKSSNKFFYFLVAVLVTASLHANSSCEIRLNAANKVLKAPEGDAYEWYLNGKLLDEQGQELQVSESGTYTVRAVSNDGYERIAEISLNVGTDGVYRIWTIGDSTMETYAEGWYPRMGWGQVFQAFFDTANVEVINRAVGGTSSKSFYVYYWSDIVSQLQPNDFVMIQFGINDRYTSDPDRYSDPNAPTSQEGSFKYNLKRYVDEAIDAGAYPILCSTIRRNSWTSGANNDGYADWAQAARDLAVEIDVPLVDIDGLGKVEMTAVGEDYATEFWYMSGDPIHIQEMGAIKNAELAVEGLKLLSTDTQIAPLLDYLRPTYEVNVSTNYPDDVLLSRTENYPSGLTYTLKAFFDTNSYVWAGWFDENDNRISFDRPYYFTVEDQDYTIEARLDTDFSKLDCSGVYEGGAEMDECGVCTGGTTSLSPCYSGFANGQMVSIQLKHSELCLTEGDVVTQEECSDAETQLWELNQVDGEIAVYTIKNPSSGEYLLYNGAYVVPDRNGSNWLLEEVESDVYRIAFNNNTSTVMAISSTSTDAGERLRVISRSDEAAANLFSITELATLGVEPSSLVTCFPNPTTNGKIYFEKSELDIIGINLLDMAGRLIRKSKWKREMDVSDLKKGMYVLYFVDESNFPIQKSKIIIE